MGKSCRVRQGGLGHAPAVAVGSSSMTITGTLALFAALWARVLKRNEFRVKQIRYKTKTTKNEELQVQQRILLFFFLVRAERGEIEVRLASGATRRRSRFPCPLGQGQRRRRRAGCSAKAGTLRASEIPTGPVRPRAWYIPAIAPGQLPASTVEVGPPACRRCCCPSPGSSSSLCGPCFTVPW